MNPVKGRPQAERDQIQPTTATLRLVLAYAFFAGLWILVSDEVVLWLFSDTSQIVLVSTLKGSLFVATTTVLLYGLIRRLVGRALISSLREREAQKEYLRTQQLLAAIVDSSTDVIFAKDLEGRYLLVNRETARITGKAAEQVLNCDDTELFPLEQALSIRANDRRAIVENRVNTYEETLLTVNGERTYLAIKGPLRDGDGHVIGSFGISRDISVRKHFEVELRALSRAMEQSPASIVITDRNGMIEYVNPRFEQVTGYTRAEVAGRNPNILKSGANAPELYEDLWSVIAVGGEWHGELCNRRKNGELFWESAAISGVRDEGGKIAHYIAVKEDITERKRADALLNENKERLSAVFYASPIGISVSSRADGKIIDVNDAALRMFGYTRDEVVGHTLTKLSAHVRPEQIEDLVRRLRKSGSVDRFPIDFYHSNGEASVIEASVRTIELQGEQCLVTMMVDVTERKRLEQAHLQAQKLGALGTLAGGIAHDFNNILAAIRGNADLAAQDVGPDHIAAESLAEIRKASSRASEVVRRILAFGRPNETRQQVVDLREAVGEVLKLLRSTLPMSISLRTDFATDTPHVLADAGQIHEVIVNLTTNAAYAIGPRAGSIEYRLEPVQVDEDFARSIPDLREGRYARLEVLDSGCGMNEATLGRIFDAFYTTKPVGQGTGLGLSMVHGIMRSHGGAVTVTSSPGKGSRFVLYFLATDDRARNAEESVPAKSAIRPGRRVMYVDDEEALVFLASRVLSRMGHKISSFTDPEKAMEALRAHPQDYDAVVTDLSMPHMSGLEFACEVHAVRPEMPVLMTTGYVRPEDEFRARAAGIREVILKPATMDELGLVLDRLLRDSPARE